MAFEPVIPDVCIPPQSYLWLLLTCQANYASVKLMCLKFWSQFAHMPTLSLSSPPSLSLSFFVSPPHLLFIFQCSKTPMSAKNLYISLLQPLFSLLCCYFIMWETFSTVDWILLPPQLCPNVITILFIIYIIQLSPIL